MFRVAGPQLFPDLRVRLVPEASKIPRELNRTAVWGQQSQQDRLPPRTDPRRVGEPKQLLQLDGCRYAPVVGVREGNAASAGNGDRFGGVTFQPSCRFRRQRTTEIDVVERARVT